MRENTRGQDERMRPGAAPPSPQARRRAYRLRHLLASVHMPLYLALAVLFGVWAWGSQAGFAPSPWALGAIALLFAVLALLALADAAVIRDHRRRRGVRR
ncbi:hypothetical protein [Streptomyces chryseus]|uniref:hypothetical protein n=1 Tax=Streptomyces chryseus TaxID=68186 RepID=UPI00110F7C81|nr:hypothetical protein [Streptomyces chryseus]GGX14661.1 hypothetical protein GCM10010353_32540 [Streptomyces chryseus]